VCALLPSRIGEDLQNKVINVCFDERYLNWFHTKFHRLVAAPTYTFIDEYTHLESLTPKFKFYKSLQIGMENDLLGE